MGLRAFTRARQVSRSARTQINRVEYLLLNLAKKFWSDFTATPQYGRLQPILGHFASEHSIGKESVVTRSV